MEKLKNRLVLEEENREETVIRKLGPDVLFSDPTQWLNGWRFFEMERIGKPVSPKALFLESDTARQFPNLSSTLEMWVENDLGYGKHSPRFQRIEKFPQGRLPIGNLPKDSHKQGSVKPVLLEFALTQPSIDEKDVFKPGLFRLFPGTFQHALLDVQRHHKAISADLFCGWYGQASRAASRVKDGHSRFQLEVFEDDRGAVRPGEGIVQLDEPSEPSGTGERVPARCHAPRNKGKKEKEKNGDRDSQFFTF